MPTTRFSLNGKPTEVPFEEGMNLLEVLREQCGVISAKNGCAPEGTCGCCTVLVDGKPVMSCLRSPALMDGHEIVTLEGIPEEMRNVLGNAFVKEGGLQCGFCIPGIVVRASALVRQNCTDDRAAVAKALDAHVCRCTGYVRILDAIQTAGEAWRNGGPLPREEPRRHLYFGEQFGLCRKSRDSNRSIGRSESRFHGFEQTLGGRPFVGDMGVPGMLHGSVVLSEHPRARVLALHSSEAAAMPGVVRIFTAADAVEGRRGTGMNLPDLPIFVAVGEITCCVGDFLAMVVADTEFHARKAAGKIRVDYEVLEPVTDPFRALEPDSPRIHSEAGIFACENLVGTNAFSRGDVDTALATAAHVVEQTFATQAIDPAFLEPEACLAIPKGRGIKVHTQSQGSVFDQKQIAYLLNLPLDDVEIALAASGGAFGAKEELSIQGQTSLAAYCKPR